MKSLCRECALTLTLGMLALVGFAQAQNSNLGRIDFPNSGAPEAQEAFRRAVLLLHSFEYEDAREAFQEARRIDPNFALAYWGEAMTYNHPLWRKQDGEAARAALRRLAPTPEGRLAKAPTEREKGYLRAIEALSGEGDKLRRDLAYAKAMRHLHELYPKDLEAASFYALAILGTAQGERDSRTYMRAAAIVEEVFDKNPEHPGAAHYLIHSYDDPVHAPLGLRAARVFATIAPAASHAQHMISHIYVALGFWEEVVTANEKAYAVADQRARRKGLSVDARNFHALHWLEYAYLQQGRYREGRRKLELMEHAARQSGSHRSLWYYAQMRAGYLVETQRWQDAPARLDTSGITLGGAAADLFATGFSAAKAGDSAAAEKALAQLRSRIGSTQLTAAGERSDTYGATAQGDVKMANILERELTAQVLLADGETEEALRVMEEATAQEDNLPFMFGPPKVVKPSHELFGEMLLELDRPTEARKQFELALERAPRRALSLLGLARAAARSGDSETVQRTYAELKSIWMSADADLPALREVSGSLMEARPR